MRHARVVIIALLPLAVLGAELLQPPLTFAGKAVRVHDGDTAVIATDAGRRIAVRLSGIDAPERVNADVNLTHFARSSPK